MNEFKLFGRVGRDPEGRDLKSGSRIVNFSLATDNGKDANGQKREPTWHRVTCTGKTADLVEKYVHKGDLLLASGNIGVSKRTIGDKQIDQINLYANHIEFGGGGSRQDSQSAPASRRGGDPAPVDDDDIQF